MSHPIRVFVRQPTSGESLQQIMAKSQVEKLSARGTDCGQKFRQGFRQGIGQGARPLSGARSIGDRSPRPPSQGPSARSPTSTGERPNRRWVNGRTSGRADERTSGRADGERAVERRLGEHRMSGEQAGGRELGKRAAERSCSGIRMLVGASDERVSGRATGQQTAGHRGTSGTPAPLTSALTLL
jgi:hypothetical protein